LRGLESAFHDMYRWSKLFIPTLREAPADAEVASHKLLLRAGYIRQLGAGIYSYLFLGNRAINKIIAIVRQEMDTIGQEFYLPALNPKEVWEESGRWTGMGDNMFRLKDRKGAEFCLAMTHEEVMTTIARSELRSYKQLPQIWYQIQTKFRDEPRPRFGLMRVREFIMMDAYSFHTDIASLDKTYNDMYAAYQRIFTRCGIPFVAVEAESGPIGGSASHEFMTVCDAGEDTILASDKGNYAANVEKAQTGPRPWTLGGAPTGELDKVHTPNLPGIDDVGKFLKVKPRNMLKTLVFRTNHTGPVTENATRPHWLVAVVRGDHDVNPAKLAQVARQVFQIESIEMKDDAEVRAKWAIGFVGPDAATRALDAVLVIDPDAAREGFWASGANEVDYHVKHFNWFRECGDKLADPKKTAVADIRNAVAGDPSPLNDGGALAASKGIEIGHVFKLGTKYSEKLGAEFLDDKGVRAPMIMGCYGIGVGRILIAAVESSHDDKGIIWPAAIAPFSVIVTPIKNEGEIKSTAESLYTKLNEAGIDTLLDDRDARPGVKFNDADLIGFPLRITIGDRGLKEGKVELKLRTSKDSENVAIDAVIDRVRALLKV